MRKYTKNPLFRGLPKEVKDPENFKGIEQRLRLAVVSDHKHKNIGDYVGCVRCQKKMARRKEIMREVGFKSPEQHLEWRKTMNIIKGLNL